ncbi:isopentenyl-diphosphate Delta-isomerase [Catellatospora tritici]|uniref:isopentenyl-diphosphate Delta-isomerase n=1 Tax=Catellatospora tritici TaxID=2851566 RepID=UPI001C2D285F|nr:isopentenyl-diphosphate Delta-isomerase [Catellatospora tritici]MBV1852034.1 isopentenyl-diphosphate Delta-isomerase [Catellatospora tritici]
MRSREEDLVELVDADGAACGKATVAQAHSAPGSRHRAFSVHLMDSSGRLLLQQRASVKTRFALRWANATCGHPAPGEPVVLAAARRLAEEVGVRSVELTEIGVYGYRAVDPETGRVEDEYDHVLLGILGTEAEPPRPDPAEVAALRWISPADLRAWLGRSPDDFAPWLAGVTDVALGDNA